MLKRGFTAALLLAAATAVPAAAPANAQDARDAMEDVELRVEHLRGGLFALFGRGGNIGVSVGEDGVFLVDDQFAPLTDRIVAAVADIHPGPIRFVINTHWHFDHTGGNENLGNAGAVIVAHDNVRVRMSQDSFIEAFNREVKAAPPAALPVVTFSDKASLHLNGEEARIHHVPNAHTDGDGIVHFTGTNVVHMGDVFFNDRYPFIDVGSGGSLDGMIAAVAMVLAMTDDDTIIIPGHGPVTDKAGLREYHRMLSHTRDRVAALIAEGRDLDAVVAAKPMAAFEAAWGQGDDWTTSYVGFAYQSLKR